MILSIRVVIVKNWKRRQIFPNIFEKIDIQFTFTLYIKLENRRFSAKAYNFSDTNIRLFRSPVFTGISLPMSRIENWKQTYLTWMVKVSTKQLASNWHSLLKLNFKRGYFQTSMTIFSANDKHYLDWMLLCMFTPRAKN